MLTKNEIHEVIEPALYLIISGLPNTKEALIVTDQHLACIQSALNSYRKGCSNQTPVDMKVVQDAVGARIEEIQTSSSIGISRLLNGFYFHTPQNAKAALAALKKYIIQDIYISPNQTAVDMVEKALNKAA